MMEADWEFEVGGDAPVIDACWTGLVDLQRAPEAAWNLPECVAFPALAEALTKLNAAASPVWSSKCDFWPSLEAGEFDLDELDAPADCAAHAVGCYIDLLPKIGWQQGLAEAACKRFCGLLRAVPLRLCRTDLVIRRALIAAGEMDLGVTAYLTACGPSSVEAKLTLEAALTALTDAVGCVGEESTLE
jgi:hypothetical protein